MGFGWILGIGVIILIFFFLRPYVKRSQGRQDLTEETALDILKKRYARGEISREEYEEKKKNLMQ